MSLLRRRRQILLPGGRDLRAGNLDENGRPRRPRALAGVHLDLARKAVALAPVAACAGGDDVLPDRLAAAAAGDHVVDGEPRLARAAVLAGPGVAGEHRPPRDLAPV